MKYLFLIVVASIFLFCCRESAQSKKPVFIKDTTKMDDTIIVKDSMLQSTITDSFTLGAYQGTFPCKDCEGIQQTVFFNTDNTFKEERMIWSKNELPKTSEGSWKLKNDTIELSQDGTTVMDLKRQNDTLFAININGVQITSLSKYILVRKNLADKNPLWNKKRLEGVDFVATGNEPSWSLDIDYEKSFVFRLPDWKKPLSAPMEKPIITKDSIMYKLTTDTTTWTVIIFPQFCSDGINDYLYQYKVNVKYNNILYKGCGVQLSKKNTP